MSFQKPSELVFLGGVHGVGKSTFAQQLAEILGIKFYSASALIKEARNGIISWDSEKRVSEINKNQDLLITAIDNKRLYENPAILDGHYVLRDKEGEIKELPVNLFEAIGPKLLILLTASSNEVLHRLRARDQSNLSLQQVEKEQSLELEHAHRISKTIDVDLIEVKDADAASVASEIRKRFQDTWNLSN